MAYTGAAAGGVWCCLFTGTGCTGFGLILVAKSLREVWCAGYQCTNALDKCVDMHPIERANDCLKCSQQQQLL